MKTPAVQLMLVLVLAAGCGSDPGRQSSGPRDDAADLAGNGSAGGSGIGTGGGGGSGGLGAGGAGGRDASVFEAPASDVPAFEVPERDVVDGRPASETEIGDGAHRYPDPNGMLCGSSRHTLGKATAEVVVVLDRSGSMSALTIDPRTRWDDARDAIYGAVLANQNLAWGLKLFPSGSGSGDCTLDPKVEVPVGFGNGPALQAAIDPAGPPLGPLGGGTPTDSAVNAASAYLKTVRTTLPKYLVLVTDGAPTCLNNDLMARNDERAIAAIRAAAAAGFKTFVIGIATDTQDIDALNKMADAGGTARAGVTHYYPTANRADLDAAFQTITFTVTTCLFPLVTRPPDPEFVGVTVGSSLIPRDVSHAQGWDYTPNMAIQIFGSACESLKRGTALNVNVYFGCPQ